MGGAARTPEADREELIGHAIDNPGGRRRAPGALPDGLFAVAGGSAIDPAKAVSSETGLPVRMKAVP